MGWEYNKAYRKRMGIITGKIGKKEIPKIKNRKHFTNAVRSGKLKRENPAKSAEKRKLTITKIITSHYWQVLRYPGCPFFKWLFIQKLKWHS